MFTPTRTPRSPASGSRGAACCARPAHWRNDLFYSAVTVCTFAPAAQAHPPRRAQLAAPLLLPRGLEHGRALGFELRVGLPLRQLWFVGHAVTHQEVELAIFDRAREVP